MVSEKEIVEAFYDLWGVRKVLKITVLCPFKCSKKHFTIRQMAEHLKKKHNINYTFMMDV